MIRNAIVSVCWNSSAAVFRVTVDRIEQQEYIRQLAPIDDLTGFANRNHFYQLLDTACVSASPSGQILAYCISISIASS
jgi:PleD family two-component response regulator